MTRLGRLDINRLFLDKLPGVLDEKQKNNKIRNMLQALKQRGLIEPDGKSCEVKLEVFSLNIGFICKLEADFFTHEIPYVKLAPLSLHIAFYM